MINGCFDRRGFLKCVGASLAAAALSKNLPAATAMSRKTPNIIFIMADDLGWGELGCYGQKRIKTPCIDRLASEGMRFMDAYCGSAVCAPSRCNLLTGMHGGPAFCRGKL